MHIISQSKFKDALKSKGYRSIDEFAKALGIHRNSIHYYLSGHGIFPKVVDKIISALGIRPLDIIVEKKDDSNLNIEGIADLVDALHKEFPDITFILFGSRVEGRASKYSDWDIGVFSSLGIEHATYRKIIQKKDEIAENSPYFIDIVNLNRAEPDFLQKISKHWLFLTGCVKDWLYLCRKVVI